MTQKFRKEYSRTKVRKLSQLLAGLREQTWKQKQHTHTKKKDMKRTHTNWSDNSKQSLWLIRRKKLQIVVSLGELFLFVAYWTMIPIFPPDPDFLLVRSRFFISIEWQVCKKGTQLSLEFLESWKGTHYFDFWQKNGGKRLSFLVLEILEFWSCAIIKGSSW